MSSLSPELAVAPGADSRDRRRVDDRVFAACGLAWASALIHVQAAFGHADESTLYVVLFAIVAVLQLAWGVAAYHRPTPHVLWAGALGSLAVAAVWAVSRTTGLPIGPEPWQPEGVGAIDSIATADEIVVALLVAIGPRAIQPGAFRRAWQLLGGVALLLALLSSLVLIGGGHVH